MVVTIQTNVGPGNTTIVTEENLEKVYLEYPEEKDRLACMSVKMLMLDGQVTNAHNFFSKINKRV